MTPEQWRRLETIVAEALDRDVAGRFAFLQEACGDDEVLRQEAQSLLGEEAE